MSKKYLIIQNQVSEKVDTPYAGEGAIEQWREKLKKNPSEAGISLYYLTQIFIHPTILSPRLKLESYHATTPDFELRPTVVERRNSLSFLVDKKVSRLLKRISKELQEQTKAER